LLTTSRIVVDKRISLQNQKVLHIYSQSKTVIHIQLVYPIGVNNLLKQLCMLHINMLINSITPE